MKQIVLGIVAVFALVVVAVGPVEAHGRSRSTAVVARGQIVDLSADADPLDGAKAKIRGRTSDRGTWMTLRIRGVDAPQGTTFGAHIHIGPCVEGDGAAAGPHTNPSGEAASPETEIWLDFEVGRRGRARARARVDFAIDPSLAQSMVIHALPTDDEGGAGARLGCLPLDYKG